MYTIKYFKSREAFDAAQTDISFSTNPWNSDYSPEIRAIVGHSDDSLFIRLKAMETDIRAAMTEDESEVCTDSCMEFFFSPEPDVRQDYFNIEINPTGVSLFDFGHDRYGRKRVVSDNSVLKIKAQIMDGFWTISYEVPYALIKSVCPSFAPEKGIKANIYSCGELAPRPHHAILYPVDKIKYPKPDFHRPEYFGEMKFN